MTVELTRRGFLEMLGLGGVALTAPKPMKLVLAKMEDLAAPPLHVGYCRIDDVPPLAQLAIHGFGVMTAATGPRGAITAERFIDYGERWSVSLFIRRHRQDKGVLYCSGPAKMVPDPRAHTSVWGDYSVVPTFPTFGRSIPIMMGEGDIAEFWFVPCDPFGGLAPRFPLPALQIAMKSVLYRPDLKSYKYHHCRDVEHVRLDRARAIEMGLVAPGEPESDE